jgi:hypothetical protein
MRPELADKKGQDYYAAWDALMLVIGAEVTAFYTDLRAWADNQQDELGLYGATCERYDLPVKTLVQWLERTKAVAHGLYDIMFYGHNVESVKLRGQQLLDWRAEGKSYAELIAFEEEARRRAVKARQDKWWEDNFPLIDKATDCDGHIIRAGDKVEFANRYGVTQTVIVKELRIRQGKRMMKTDAKVFFERANGEMENHPAIETKRLDTFYGE